MKEKYGVEKKQQ